MLQPRMSTAISICLGLLSCMDATLAVSSDARCFPSDFLFGISTEGIWNGSGREPSSSDAYCGSQTGLECGDMTEESFHSYDEDVQRMGDTGLSSFPFSISWSRVMLWDAEKRRMRANPRGLAFYHALLDDLQAKGLQPIATLYHSDLPLLLQTQLEPKGWLNPDIVTHFEDFAALAFNEYGHKVKYWATFNEPLTFIIGGYGSSDAASNGVKPSDTNSYTVAHNVLRSHARAVALFRDLKQKGDSVVDTSARIGIVLNAAYGYPVDESNALDVVAAERKMQFDLSWFLMPLVAGDYPEVMRERVGERLAKFTAEETGLIKGSYDVLMLSHYYSRLVTDCDMESFEIFCDALPLGHARDRGIDDTRAPNGAPIPPASSTWLTGNLNGYMATIKWLHARDPTTEILLTENEWYGNDQADNVDQLGYFQAYMEQVYKAVVDEKIPIIGIELRYVNYPKSASPEPAKWFAHLSTTKCLDDWNLETDQMGTEEKQEATATREELHSPEVNDNGKGVPWSLSEVILLLVVGLVVLGAITCEAIRELHLTRQGSSEELQVLITIEE